MADENKEKAKGAKPEMTPEQEAEIDANGKKRRVCVKCGTAFETA